MMTKGRVLRMVKHGIDKRWGPIMDGMDGGNCQICDMGCEICPLDLTLSEKERQRLTIKGGCHTLYEKYDEAKDIKGVDSNTTKEYATQMYLLLCTIYFELVHNWEGYKNSVREVE